MTVIKEELKAYIQHLPEKPGVYKFFDHETNLIYVGKAKSIKKRVSSYFSKTATANRKTKRLVSEIRKIEYILAETEFDALLLENNLIKQNQPKYNILLKDDKTFPYLCILYEPFPRVISTRKYIRNQSEYFGPYSSALAMKNVLELIRKLYTIRTCNLALTPANIEQKKFKVCLEYHIGNCQGPCEGLQSEHNYLNDIDQVRHILKGQLSIIEKYFKGEMVSASQNLQFEKAQLYKDKLATLEKFQSKSMVVNKTITDLDVITLVAKDDFAYINYLLVKEGAIIFSKSVEIKKKLDEEDEDILSYSLLELRLQSQSSNLQVLSNLPIKLLPQQVENTVPKIGDKQKLVQLSIKNALELHRERILLHEDKLSRKNEVLVTLQHDMRLTTLPKTIECFDNSNLQGSTPVASMVRFVDGKPDKKNYRHFNIKSVTGANDFASMKEIVARRYKRLIDENHPLPNLILIDGGKGQLTSACEALKEVGIYGQVPIVGIAKKLEELYYPEDPLPLLINKKSQGLRLLQFIRDEAHRFAITFHRTKRSKEFVKSGIHQLPGIGNKTAEKLLKKFKSVKKIYEASPTDIEQVVGKQKAKIILDQKTKAS